MTFDPKEEGFEWPQECVIENASGAKLTVCPAVLRAHYDEETNERAKECYRLYETDMGLLSELEVKHWQTGGHDPEMEVWVAYHDLFVQKGTKSLPLGDVLDALLKKDFAPIVIKVTVGWMIKGQYVQFDREAMTVSDNEQDSNI